MRLTKKADKEHEHLKMCIGWYELPTKDYHVRIINETPNQMYQKLGQLEDIEEELGIDLITFFKIYNADKVYIKGKDYYWKIRHYNRRSISVGTNKIICLSFKDYGKTWSIKKEDLE